MAKIAPQSPCRNKIKLKENEKEGKPVSRVPTASWCYSTEDVRGRAEQRQLQRNQSGTKRILPCEEQSWRSWGEKGESFSSRTPKCSVRLS